MSNAATQLTTLSPKAARWIRRQSKELEAGSWLCITRGSKATQKIVAELLHHGRINVYGDGTDFMVTSCAHTADDMASKQFGGFNRFTREISAVRGN